jgi:hypothetical protein
VRPFKTAQNLFGFDPEGSYRFIAEGFGYYIATPTPRPVALKPSRINA